MSPVRFWLWPIFRKKSCRFADHSSAVLFALPSSRSTNLHDFFRKIPLHEHAISLIAKLQTASNLLRNSRSCYLHCPPQDLRTCAIYSRKIPLHEHAISLIAKLQTASNLLRNPRKLEALPTRVLDHWKQFPEDGLVEYVSGSESFKSMSR